MGTFHLFKLNPEEFIIKAGLIINDCKALAVIQCIRYEKLNDKFSTDIFDPPAPRHAHHGTKTPRATRHSPEYSAYVRIGLGLKKYIVMEIE